MRRFRMAALAAAFALAAGAQVYSPTVLRKGQPDASDLRKLAAGIYAGAGARTPRERAEAVWRFFLTDGRFVKPGFWYHIAGWAYEEPAGEVLDPLKLLNSYGFGLCYHIAPLLEAVWKAGGFDDARVWFLTGHTVAEVYYEGAYHYFDSDMMGYNTVGRGPVERLPVASVHQIEQDGGIILSKLKSPTQADPAAVAQPWYPADVREAAIGGLAELFTTTADNHLFPFERAPQGHSMNFELRPGERLVRYFQPERDDLFYLPYKFTGRAWEEFPQEIAQYRIRTADGPRSQKDARRWATGRIEYRLPVPGEAAPMYEVRSPYVIIDAEFQFDAVLPSEAQSLAVETSTDGGRTWLAAGKLRGPHRGTWRCEPAVLMRSAHGRRTAVSGTYGYLVRIAKGRGSELRGGLLLTRIQLNPRTLPDLAAGHNELIYTAGPAVVRRAIAAEPSQRSNARYVSDGAQGYWIPAGDGPAEFTFHLAGPAGAPLAGFAAGGRFLDLSGGLAPDKFTAEVRKVAAIPARNPAASIAWSTSPEGPFQTIWQYDPRLQWKDGIPIDRTLRWPEVDRHVAVSGAHDVYVRYRIQDMALDQFRLAVEGRPAPGASALEVTHIWKQDGIRKSMTQRIPAGAAEYRYAIDIPPGAAVSNEAVIFECRGAPRNPTGPELKKP
jgi:hypothetical protein